MASFLFGKKRRVHRKRKASRGMGKKPRASVLRAAKKYRVKIYKKVGKKKVYRTTKAIKRDIKRRMAKRHAKKHSKKHSKRVVRRSRFRFGSGAFVNPPNFGYNQPVGVAQGILDQSVSVVPDAAMNATRPPGFGLSPSDVPTYGTNRPFFTQDVPVPTPPNWYFMGQPDGSLYPVGGPFNRYSSPVDILPSTQNFGTRRHRSGNKWKVGKRH